MIIEDLQRARAAVWPLCPLRITIPSAGAATRRCSTTRAPRWFIRMTAVRDELVRNNRTVNWMPDNIKEGRMGNFLENVIDWGLSPRALLGHAAARLGRARCGHMHVIGSRRGAARDGPRRAASDIELHRPYIDQVDITCPECGKRHAPRQGGHRLLVRFSGSMPFAQWHYPFENKEIFEKRFPANFISEAIDQTRGWFYTLHGHLHAAVRPRAV